MSARTAITATVACIATLTIAVGCTGPGAPSTPAPDPAHGALNQLDNEALHLVVGDSLDLAELFSSESRRWAFSSTDASRVPVTPTGQLRALSPGNALIVATIASLSVRDTVKVIVMPRREAVNRMVSEVCPNEDERGIVLSQPYDSLPIIHEYHDCQRLIAGRQYSALVGIFAHQHVDSFQNRESFANGRLAAVIVDFITKKQLMPYASLGITPGTNCLVIKSNPRDTWEAAIVNQSPALSLSTRRYLPCRNDMTWSDVPASARGKLVVVVQKGVDMRGRAIAPPVARWDWDERHQMNYIGVKCDSVTWCEIGPPDFAPSTPERTMAGQPIFKGYYDEQYLADSAGTQVSSTWGTIVPGTNARDTADMLSRRGAKVHLSHLRIAERGDGPTRAYTYYRKKFIAADTAPLPPFRRAATADLMIIPISGSASYALGGISSSGGPTSTGTSLGLFGVYAGESNGTWLGPRGVAFRSHPSSVVKVPTVRWRWKFDDEGAWGFCRPHGCCESFYAE